MSGLARLLLLLLTAVYAEGQVVTPDSYSLQQAFPHLTFKRPLALIDPHDGTNRRFVVEQAGRIFVFENKADVRKANLFLDIRDRVNSHGNEEGLLGLAFHPNYSINGDFFVNYCFCCLRRENLRLQRSK